MVQGIPSLVCPFAGDKVHWTLSGIRLTHSYGYASAGDRPTCFASLTQNSDKIAWSDFEQPKADPEGERQDA